MVDLVVMPLAQRQQIVDVSQSAGFPEDDVMQFGTRLAHTTPRDRARGIHGAEGAALRPISQPGGAAEVQFAGGVDDHPVAHGDGLVNGRLVERLQNPIGQLNR